MANAILDGTDCVMLSGESAMGKYPEESVAMLAKIAAYTEAHRPPTRLQELEALAKQDRPTSAAGAMALMVEHALNTVPCAAVNITRLASMGLMSRNAPVAIASATAAAGTVNALVAIGISSPVRAWAPKSGGNINMTGYSSGLARACWM